MITVLDKVFLNYIGKVYKANLDVMSVEQVVCLRRAFYFG